MDIRTPTYIILKETKRGEVWIEPKRRAVRFEENNRSRSDKVIVAKCMKRMKIRERQGKKKSINKKKEVLNNIYVIEAKNNQRIGKATESGVTETLR